MTAVHLDMDGANGRAVRHHAEVADEMLDRVVGEQRHAVAGVEPTRAQCGRYPRGDVAQFTIRDRAAIFRRDDPRLAGVARGRAGDPFAQQLRPRFDLHMGTMEHGAQHRQQRGRAPTCAVTLRRSALLRRASKGDPVLGTRALVLRLAAVALRGSPQEGRAPQDDGSMHSRAARQNGHAVAKPWPPSSPARITPQMEERMAKLDEQPDAMGTQLGGSAPIASGGIGSNTAPHLAYHDLRKWIEEADKLGEIKRVQGLSWQQDIGLVSEMATHDDSAPCFVFEDVPGTIPGSRVLTNFFNGKRKNMTLGFPVDLSRVELSEGFRVHYTSDMKRIPPKEVATGPVMANVMTGDTIDVTKFPAPQWHSKDGGRYIGTGCYNIMRDPDTGWINCGTYRVMIHDAKTLGFYISPGKHGRQIRDKYKARGERMPVVTVCGGDPMSFLMGCSEIPQGVNELEVVGGMRGSPVEVIKGPVTGLPIPANAEIVIEGFVDPGNERIEGPFGEWTGYYASDLRPEPVIDIQAIYYRDEPILLGCVPERPPDEICRYRAIVRSALLRDNIEKAGVPAVKAAWAHEIGNARLLLAVAITQRYPGHAKQAGHIATMCHVAAYCGRYTVVVDDDIDVSNLDEVMWALLTRSDPATSIEIIRGAWSTPLDPRIEPERRAVGDYTNSRAVIDACRPWHWRDKFPMVNALSAEERRVAVAKFGHLFKG